MAHPTSGDKKKKSTKVVLMKGPSRRHQGKGLTIVADTVYPPGTTRGNPTISAFFLIFGRKNGRSTGNNEKKRHTQQWRKIVLFGARRPDPAHKPRPNSLRDCCPFSFVNELLGPVSFFRISAFMGPGREGDLGHGSCFLTNFGVLGDLLIAFFSRLRNTPLCDMPRPLNICIYLFAARQFARSTPQEKGASVKKWRKAGGQNSRQRTRHQQKETSSKDGFCPRMK